MKSYPSNALEPHNDGVHGTAAIFARNRPEFSLYSRYCNDRFEDILQRTVQAHQQSSSRTSHRVSICQSFDETTIQEIAHTDRVPGTIELMQLLTLLLSYIKVNRAHPPYWTFIQCGRQPAKALRGHPSIRST